MRVGCRALVSPLLPFLIFDDFNKTTKKTTKKTKCTSQIQTRGVLLSPAGRVRAGSRWYLVSQSLRGRVPDPAAMRHTHQLCAQLQHVSKRQVADVGVVLTSETRGTGLSTVHTGKLLLIHCKLLNICKMV